MTTICVPDDWDADLGEGEGDSFVQTNFQQTLNPNLQKASVFGGVPVNQYESNTRKINQALGGVFDQIGRQGSPDIAQQQQQFGQQHPHQPHHTPIMNNNYIPPHMQRHQIDSSMFDVAAASDAGSNLGGFSGVGGMPQQQQQRRRGRGFNFVPGQFGQQNQQFGNTSSSSTAPGYGANINIYQQQQQQQQNFHTQHISGANAIVGVGEGNSRVGSKNVMGSPNIDAQSQLAVQQSPHEDDEIMSEEPYSDEDPAHPDPNKIPRKNLLTCDTRSKLINPNPRLNVGKVQMASSFPECMAGSFRAAWGPNGVVVKPCSNTQTQNLNTTGEFHLQVLAQNSFDYSSKNSSPGANTTGAKIKYTTTPRGTRIAEYYIGSPRLPQEDHDGGKGSPSRANKSPPRGTGAAAVKASSPPRGRLGNLVSANANTTTLDLASSENKLETRILDVLTKSKYFVHEYYKIMLNQVDAATSRRKVDEINSTMQSTFQENFIEEPSKFLTHLILACDDAIQLGADIVNQLENFTNYSSFTNVLQQQQNTDAINNSALAVNNSRADSKNKNTGAITTTKASYESQVKAVKALVQKRKAEIKRQLREIKYTQEVFLLLEAIDSNKISHWLSECILAKVAGSNNWIKGLIDLYEGGGRVDLDLYEDDDVDMNESGGFGGFGNSSSSSSSPVTQHINKSSVESFLQAVFFCLQANKFEDAIGLLLKYRNMGGSAYFNMLAGGGSIGGAGAPQVSPPPFTGLNALIGTNESKTIFCFDRLIGVISSCIGGINKNRELLNDQLLLWEKHGYKELMPKMLWNIYSLLAGNIEEIVGEGQVGQYESTNTKNSSTSTILQDWRSSLGIYYWYKRCENPEDMSLEDAIDLYENSGFCDTRHRLFRRENSYASGDGAQNAAWAQHKQEQDVVMKQTTVSNNQEAAIKQQTSFIQDFQYTLLKCSVGHGEFNDVLRNWRVPCLKVSKNSSNRGLNASEQEIGFEVRGNRIFIPGSGKQAPTGSKDGTNQEKTPHGQLSNAKSNNSSLNSIYLLLSWSLTLLLRSFGKMDTGKTNSGFCKLCEELVYELESGGFGGDWAIFIATWIPNGGGNMTKLKSTIIEYLLEKHGMASFKSVVSNAIGGLGSQQQQQMLVATTGIARLNVGNSGMNKVSNQLNKTSRKQKLQQLNKWGVPEIWILQMKTNYYESDKDWISACANLERIIRLHQQMPGNRNSDVVLLDYFFFCVGVFWSLRFVRFFWQSYDL